jgi:hypothetical protein
MIQAFTRVWLTIAVLMATLVSTVDGKAQQADAIVQFMTKGVHQMVQVGELMGKGTKAYSNFQKNKVK